VLNSRLALKQEIEEVLSGMDEHLPSLPRPQFNQFIREEFVQEAGEGHPVVFKGAGDQSAPTLRDSKWRSTPTTYYRVLRIVPDSINSLPASIPSS
jgi:hypothetical protein